MKFLKVFIDKGLQSGELIEFFWKAKLWFLIPVVVLMVVFGLILAFAQATGVAPFIYTLF